MSASALWDLYLIGVIVSGVCAHENRLGLAAANVIAAFLWPVLVPGAILHYVFWAENRL